jgi:TadE-like protein
MPIVPCRRRPGASGQSMVEIALMLPVVLILILGAVDVSQVLSVQQHLENAVHDAARRLVTTPSLRSPGALSAYIVGESGLSPVSAGATYSLGGDGADQVVVTATYNYPLLIPGLRAIQLGGRAAGSWPVTVAAHSIAATSAPLSATFGMSGTAKTVTVTPPNDDTVPSGLTMICALGSGTVVRNAHPCPWTWSNVATGTYTATVMQLNGVTSPPITVTVP